jgi:hypothetical protein
MPRCATDARPNSRIEPQHVGELFDESLRQRVRREIRVYGNAEVQNLSGIDAAGLHRHERRIVSIDVEQRADRFVLHVMYPEKSASIPAPVCAAAMRQPRDAATCVRVLNGLRGDADLERHGVSAGRRPEGRRELGGEAVREDAVRQVAHRVHTT